WYRKRTSDILRGAQVSTMVGLSAPTINDGVMVNTGHEIAISYRNFLNSGRFEGLQYGGGVYFDFFKNKWSEFGSREIDGINIRQNGLPYNSFYLLEMEGIFQSQEDIANSPKQFDDNVQPGDIKYRDVNRDGVVNE